MTTTATPRTVGDRDRATYTPPVTRPSAVSNAERQAAVDRWAAVSDAALRARVARRGELIRGLDECDQAAAVLELRPEVAQREQAAAEATALVEQAAALVDQARKALVAPDTEIAECARRVADLEEALTASVGDVATIKNLRVELAAYRDTMRDLGARRTGPADQLAAAQATLRNAQAADAAAVEALDTARTKLVDPVRWAPGARLIHTARTCLLTITQAMAGEPVDVDEYTAARELLQAVFVGAGFAGQIAAQAERRGRDDAWRELHRMPPHMRP
jgi:hypothetical protein